MKNTNTAPQNGAKEAIVTTLKNGKATQNQSKAGEEMIKKILSSPPTAESRLANLRILNEISKRLEFLRKSREEFNLFIASYDGTSSKLTLENSQGFKFSITRTDTLKKVFEIINADLGEVTERAEKELLGFPI